MDKAVDIIKAGGSLRGTGDNWDLKILKSLRKLVNNEDLHLMASNLIENRVDCKHLDNSIHNTKAIKRETFSPSKQEWERYIYTSKVLIGRIIVQFLTKLSFFKNIIPEHITHRYSDQMAKKSNIIPLPIIDANETNYAEVVPILRTYEKWIAEIYHEAGHLENIPQIDDTYQITSNKASPGQTMAHTIFTEDDPMKEMKIVFSGDQLTRVRFAGGKDLLAGAHTPSDRFEHCSPFKIAMWHCKASLLQHSYDFLYSSNSTGQRGTLKFFREMCNRKNATPTKVLDSYEGSEELFLSVGKAYIINAMMKLLGINAMDEKPKNYPLPKNIIHDTNENKKNIGMK